VLSSLSTEARVASSPCSTAVFLLFRAATESPSAERNRSSVRRSLFGGGSDWRDSSSLRVISYSWLAASVASLTAARFARAALASAQIWSPCSMNSDLLSDAGVVGVDSVVIGADSSSPPAIAATTITNRMMPASGSTSRLRMRSGFTDLAQASKG
jgi:hypothetical protein